MEEITQNLDKHYTLYIIIGLIILSTVFILIREIMLWYWKITTIVKNQNYGNQLLEKQNKLLEENTIILKQFVDDFSNK